MSLLQNGLEEGEGFDSLPNELCALIAQKCAKTEKRNFLSASRAIWEASIITQCLPVWGDVSIDALVVAGHVGPIMPWIAVQSGTRFCRWLGRWQSGGIREATLSFRIYSEAQAHKMIFFMRGWAAESDRLRSQGLSGKEEGGSPFVASTPREGYAAARRRATPRPTSGAAGQTWRRREAAHGKNLRGSGLVSIGEGPGSASASVSGRASFEDPLSPVGHSDASSSDTHFHVSGCVSDTASSADGRGAALSDLYGPLSDPRAGPGGLGHERPKVQLKIRDRDPNSRDTVIHFLRTSEPLLASLGVAGVSYTVSARDWSGDLRTLFHLPKITSLEVLDLCGLWWLPHQPPPAAATLAHLCLEASDFSELHRLAALHSLKELELRFRGGVPHLAGLSRLTSLEDVTLRGGVRGGPESPREVMALRPALEALSGIASLRRVRLIGLGGATLEREARRLLPHLPTLEVDPCPPSPRPSPRTSGEFAPVPVKCGR